MRRLEPFLGRLRIVGVLGLAPLLTAAGGHKEQWALARDQPPAGTECRDVPGVGLPRPIDLQAGWYHACALLADETVACVGDNRFGQLGDGTTTSRQYFAPVPGLRWVVEISLGGEHSCALRRDGEVLCWGANPFGQIGAETPRNQLSPAPVRGLGPLGGVAKVEAGGFHSCALGRGGAVACWGGSLGGRPLDGATRYRAYPRLLPSVARVVDVSIGSEEIFLHHEDGQTSGFWTTWTGWPTAAQDEEPRFLRQVPELASATAVELGSAFACAVMADRTVWCWGSNSYGQLGGARSGRTPNPAPGLQGITQVALGNEHGCALDIQGQVLCWGHNRFGRLGDAPDISAPAPLACLSRGEQVAAGRGFTCVRRQDGRVTCLGDFSEGRPR